MRYPQKVDNNNNNKSRDWNLNISFTMTRKLYLVSCGFIYEPSFYGNRFLFYGLYNPLKFIPRVFKHCILTQKQIELRKTSFIGYLLDIYSNFSLFHFRRYWNRTTSILDTVMTNMACLSKSVCGTLKLFERFGNIFACMLTTYIYLHTCIIK